jgi:NAD(P)-dependent dehydrogenase (short-subunit alcohol dehydrogenase family)
MLAGRAERSGVPVAEVERQIGASVSLGRIVTAAEVAAVVAFLASPKSVAINGDAITAGGGAVGPIYY